MHKIFAVFLLFLLFNFSCDKIDPVNNFNSEVSFKISGQLLDGNKINCIDIDAKGNVFIGSGNILYSITGNEKKSYPLDFPIMDIAIAFDETVWIGTSGGGLCHFKGDKFTWYNNVNADLPRDYVRNVEIAPDGKVWFTSCAFRIGGLGVYDGSGFDFFTPDNSPLNQNIIEDIEIDHDGIIYLATTGTVGKSNIYRITNKSWECLGDEEGMFYWINSFTLGQAGIIYLVEDFSLSSALSENVLFGLRNNKWQEINTEDLPSFRYFYSIKADKRNYCWLAGSGEYSIVLHVYNGKSWMSSPEGLFGEGYITTIETDNNNNIWVGTSQNGIYILNQ